MDGPTDPFMFLAWVALISVSGVVAPGPIFATTLARGLGDSRAGLRISLGHGLIEVPLIIAIFFGLMAILQDTSVLAGIGIVGGAFLLYMGVGMFRTKATGAEDHESKYGSLTAGALLTAANPYFLLWWATVGAALISMAAGFGLWMLPLFAVVHLACDFAWLQFLSFSVHRSRGLGGGKWFRALYMVCGAMLVFFALYFIYGSVTSLL